NLQKTTTTSTKPNKLLANPLGISTSYTTYTIYINALKDKLDKEIKKLNITKNINQFLINTPKITSIYNQDRL
ncbi:unnamed protein product, partial [Fusarium fujikuroi]